MNAVARKRGRRSAFTLIEMIASLAIMSLAFGAMLSSSLLLTRVSDVDGVGGEAGRLAHITTDLAEDLKTALAIDATASSVEITVPDRDGDGADEVLVYTWSETDGDPLTRSYNGATAVPVTGPLTAFSIGFEVETPPPDSEQLVGGHNPSSIASPGTVRMDNWNWQGQRFLPSLPSGATGWKPTRARMKCQNQSGTTSVLDTLFTSINTLYGDGTPTVTAHTFNAIDPRNLPATMAWHEADYPAAAPVIPAGQEVAFVVTTLSFIVDVDLEVDTSAAAPDGYATGNSFGYTADDSRSLVYEVYGIVYGGSVQYTQRAVIELESAGVDIAPVHVGVNTLNEPKLTGAPTVLATRERS
ncbi:MAG: type II secretion system protein [Planctomycetota bacterium]